MLQSKNLLRLIENILFQLLAIEQRGPRDKNLVYKNDETEIDTGCIIKIKNDMSNHLLLSDNSPYNIKGFLNNYKNIKFDTVWTPFNGYASDYPFCYDNLSITDKKEILKKMTEKRQQLLIKFLKKIKPNLIIPYSSQFKLKNKNEDLFNKIMIKNFNQKKYCNFQKNSKLKIYSFNSR